MDVKSVERRDMDFIDQAEDRDYGRSILTRLHTGTSI
jgi:hypothetical protein